MEQQVKVTPDMLPISHAALSIMDKLGEKKEPVPPLSAYALALRDPACFSSHVLDKPLKPN